MKMLLESFLLVGAIGSMIYNTEKSMQNDKTALNTYSHAYEIEREVYTKLREKRQSVEKRLSNVAKKKRALIEYTIPRFVEVYGIIQKIEIENSDKINALLTQSYNSNKVEKIDALNEFVKKDFTDEELVFGILTRGVFKMMKVDSERYLSAAENQLSAARVLEEQCESVCIVYDAMINHANRISTLLMGLNALFIKSIEQTESITKKNGVDIRNYTDFEKGVLMTCVNMAYAVLDIIRVPVLDENGDIYAGAMESIETGEKYIKKMKNVI